MSDRVACVVTTVRCTRERLLFLIGGTEIRVDLTPEKPTRCKAVIHAPLSVRVERERIAQEVPNDAV
jgi:hypothetical protein